jgi:hypothetical protein
MARPPFSRRPYGRLHLSKSIDTTGPPEVSRMGRRRRGAKPAVTLEGLPMESVSDRCPWCGSLISRVKFLEMQEKIRQEEQKKVEKLRQQLEAERTAAEIRVKGEAEKRIAGIVAERDRTVEKLKQMEGRETAIKTQVQSEAALKYRRDLEQVRQALSKDRDQAVLKVQADFTREREQFQKKFKDLERRFEHKSANEVGDGAEIDLFEALREAFPGDYITRYKKGQPGADILHEVRDKGIVCGRIVIDSKQRQGWQYGYVTKLREDQTEAKADHAVLSTSVFPSGKKELLIQDGVVVANPGRVVHVIELLRTFMVRIHLVGLSTQERAGKMDQLYKLLTSEEFARQFLEAGKLTDELIDIDVEEVKDHQNRWKRRGLAVTKLKNTVHRVDTQITAILQGSVGGRE